jgi:pimeloyl-ACP methyl ester carboxylesterase
MLTTTSPDGTTIAYQPYGAGPVLLLVHGTTASHQRWAGVAPQLSKEFTVVVMDRRGRGASTDAPLYALLREAVDIAAVIKALNQPVFLLGHSYGANCALEAALLSDQVSHLILYEPDLQINYLTQFPGVLDRMKYHLANLQPEMALEIMMKEIVMMPEHEFKAFTQLPMWPIRVSQAKTIPRELEAISHYQFNPEKFINLNIPTLLLLGGDSPSPTKQSTELLHSSLPNSLIVRMPGEQHIAMDTNPELFIKEVTQFLKP